VVLCLLAHGCGDEVRRSAEQKSSGDATRGALAFRKLGCGACHASTEAAPTTRVGPSLRGLARRTTLPGGLPHTPEQLLRWLRFPQQIVPTTAMPELGLSEAQARDLAAYLYTLE